MIRDSLLYNLIISVNLSKLLRFIIITMLLGYEKNIMNIFFIILFDNKEIENREK